PYLGAADRGRTGTVFLPSDFKADGSQYRQTNETAKNNQKRAIFSEKSLKTAQNLNFSVCEIFS
ncbi:MAG: hypothetical protein ACI4SH_09645, partial [Candidatus Scatosoma sp.]